MMYMRLRNSCLFVLLLLLAVWFSPAAMSQEKVRRNDFKITLLSLGSGSTRITYERAFSPEHSAEFTLGLIGLGWDWMNDSDPRGVLTKLAYKWRLIPQRSSASWLAGFYVKPELVCASFMYDVARKEESEPNKCKEKTLQVALLAECGYQLVWDWFLFDIYAGLGPSIGTGNDNNYFHSFMLFPEEGWLAFTAGFRLGVAF